MSQTCKECGEGTMVFFDGGLNHDPIWRCNNCEYETEELGEEE